MASNNIKKEMRLEFERDKKSGPKLLNKKPSGKYKNLVMTKRPSKQ